MDRDEFRTHLLSLEIDGTLPAHTLLRPSIGDDKTLTPPLPRVDVARTDSELELGETLGEGGMGIVRSAVQVSLRREVAVKTLREAAHVGRRRALLNEALVAGGLEHPNIVPIYTLGEADDGAPIIVMKRVEGLAWDACIAAPDKGLVDVEDPLGWHLEVLSQVCLAVHFAHNKGVVHRDIKPENVMLGAFGEVYLVDWGIAATIHGEKDYLPRLIQSEGVAGTPGYMAPEMTLGRGSELGTHTDIYLLGASLCEVITGAPPHSGASLFEVMLRAYESEPITHPDTAAELLQICNKAMAKDPAARFSDADEMRRAIQDHLRHRNAISLTNEALERLQTLIKLAGADAPHDETLRGVAGEARFGLNQALKIWPENDEAREAQTRWLATMVRYETTTGHLSAAESLLSQMETPPAELKALLEQAREAEAKRVAEIADLEQIRDETDLGVGAGFRSNAALVAVIFWTIMPLVGGVMTSWGDRPLSHQRYLLQTLILVGFVVGTVAIMNRRITQNLVNRQIVRLVVAFVALVPLYRVTTVLADVPTPTALSIETGLYGLMFGAVSIISGSLRTAGHVGLRCGSRCRRHLPAIRLPPASRCQLHRPVVACLDLAKSETH